MGLTAAPVPGNPILAAWGTEVRDRTIQVFATTAERDGWAAPNGAYAYVTANNATYQRSAGTWKLQGNYTAGLGSYTTDAAGWATISHGLGATPSVIQTTPSGTPGTFASTQVGTRDATTFKVMCRSQTGNAYANTACNIHWVAFR